MGKIRIKHVGFGELEEEEKKKTQKRKLKKQEKKKTARTPGLKGGERVVAVGPTPEELEKELEKGKKEVEPQRGSTSETPKSPKPPKPPKQRSDRYQRLLKLVDKNKLYSPGEALTLLKKMANARFPEKIEAHFNLKQKATGDARRRNGPGAAERQDPSPKLIFEKKIPLAHAVLGKIEESTATLEKNLTTLVKKVNPQNIKKLTLSTTMSPGIKIALR